MQSFSNPAEKQEKNGLILILFNNSIIFDSINFARKKSSGEAIQKRDILKKKQSIYGYDPWDFFSSIRNTRQCDPPPSPARGGLSQ